MHAWLSVGLKRELQRTPIEFTANLLKLQLFYYVKSMSGKQAFCAALKRKSDRYGRSVGANWVR